MAKLADALAASENGQAHNVWVSLFEVGVGGLCVAMGPDRDDKYLYAEYIDKDTPIGGITNSELAEIDRLVSWVRVNPDKWEPGPIDWS